MPIEFKVSVVKSAEGVLATQTALNGYVDASTLSEFEEVLDKLLEKGARNVLLDCTHLEYINSTGLGLFLKYTDELAQHGGTLALTCVPSNTRNVIELLGFDRDLKVFEDAASALKWIATQPKQ